ncbi:MAG: recombinase family protein, partial [Acholeplasmataceae bacterium]|nr:recombinase family protein [Acholeplasmataceae bacterium]
MRKFSEDEQKILSKIKEDGGNTPIPTCIYARKSTKDISENSIETQIESCNEFVEAHKAYFNVIGTFKDVEKSGMFTENRDEFLKIVDLVEQNQVKVMVVTKWDRFSRDPLDLRIYNEHFYRNGGVIIAVDDPIDLSAIGQLKYDIVAAFNKYYVHRIAEDTKAVLIHKTSKGQSGGGVANYGYEFDEDNYLVQNPHEAVVVQDIFDKFELGYTYGDIIDDLKTRNIKTRKGNDFTVSTIHDMLENVKYKGVYRYNRQDRKQSKIVKKQFDEVWVEDGIKDPIITVKQFDEIQKILKLRKGIIKESDYLLSGVMECEHCGAKMYGSSQSAGKNKPRQKYYVCPNHLQKNGGTCANKGIDASTLESRIQKDLFETVKEYLSSSQIDTTEFQVSLTSKKRLKQSIQKSIDNFQNNIDRATDGLLEPGIRDSTRASFEKKIEDNTVEIDKLKAKMKLADEAILSYEAVIGKDGKISITEDTLFKNTILARQLIRLLVDKITVGNENI